MEGTGVGRGQRADVGSTWRGGIAVPRRVPLVAVLALGGAALSARDGGRPPRQGSAAPPQERVAPAAPWQLLRAFVASGGPNRNLGLVQGQGIFHRIGPRLARAGLIRVRVPASLIAQGEDGWHRDRFVDGWWMERLHALGMPFKAVVELPAIEYRRRFTDEQHAAHATRLVQRARPDVVIIGNELNAFDRHPDVDPAALVERYLDRYAVIHAAVRAAAPATRIQLYGEAYFGEPDDPEALLRRVLATMRLRGLPPPDVAGFHVYDHAAVIPARAAAYRRLLADFGLHLPLSLEEVGPRRGVVDDLEARRLANQPAEAGDRYRSRLVELLAEGWITEDEQTELVAQHLATAAAAADQVQVFCAIDFLAELQWRRGLMSFELGRARPALRAFEFMQRLLNGLQTARLVPPAENAGVTAVHVVRRDGLSARIHWSAPVGDEPLAAPRPLVVPPYTFVCDARGQLLHPPQAAPHPIELPGSTTAECGGAVRIFL
jgi:hypothetical protein